MLGNHPFAVMFDPLEARSQSSHVPRVDGHGSSPFPAQVDVVAVFVVDVVLCGGI